MRLVEGEDGMDAARRAPSGSPAAPRRGDAAQHDPLRLGRLELTTRSSRIGRLPRQRRVRWWLRRLKHTFVMFVAFGLLAGMAVGSLFLLTPSVSSATARAQALSRAHHGTFLTHPVPRRVAAALIAAGGQPLNSAASVGLTVPLRMPTGPGSAGVGHGWLYHQLARDLYGGGQSGLLAAVEQAIVGFKLRLTYSATTLLGLYANIADFGHGYIGLAAASCGYFARRPADLSWGQAAMIAAVSRAPAADDPFAHRANARAAQAAVLARLIATGQITPRQATRAYRRALHLSRRGAALCSRRQKSGSGRSSPKRNPASRH
jgi:transglycosylase-like protein